jgi:transmembrane sensor
MSNPVSENRVPAAKIHAAATDWVVERHTSDSWDLDKQAELNAWLAQSVAHRVAYVRFEDIWTRSNRLAALGGTSRAQAVFESLRNLRPLFFRVAAACVYIAVMGGLLYYFLRPVSNAQTFATPVGGHETIILADGSQIELNTNTVVRVSETHSERDITLEKGEAFFRVKHNPKRPFVVTSGTRRIVDVGTQFLVRTGANRLEVGLIEGRVAFDSNGTHQTNLTPGDLLVATADSVSMTQVPAKQMSDMLAWRKGLVIFHQTPLGAAAAEYNRYNREKIVIADANAAQLAISGTLPANDPDEFARVAQTFFHLRIRHQDGAIVISR